MPRRRSYDQYCATARALDAVGDRWALLIVRELLAGPRRYTDLHADLPGVSTDVLASRLKDMERDGLVTRRRLPPPSSSAVYELTERGGELLPVLTALARWGGAELGEPGPTDAVRAHWFALPLRAALDEVAGAEAVASGRDGGSGVVEVRLDEGVFHLRLDGRTPVYGEGAVDAPDACLALDVETCRALGDGTLALGDAVRDGRVTVTGEGVLAKVLRGE